MMLRKVGLILLMQMSSLCVFAQTSLDTTTMLNSVTVTYNENPAIVIIKEASKTYKEYSKHHPKNLRIYSSRSRSPKGLRFEQVSNVFLESGRPYQEIEAFKDYKENRVNFGNSMEVKANAEVNFNSDFDFSDTEDKGGFEEYPLTNYSNFEWTPLSDVNRSLLSADRIPGLLSQGSIYRYDFKLIKEEMTEYGNTYVIDFDSKAGNSWEGELRIAEEGFRVISVTARILNQEISQNYSMDAWFYVRVMKWNFKNANEEFFAEVLNINTARKPLNNKKLLVAYFPETQELEQSNWDELRPSQLKVDDWTKRQDSLIKYLNSDEYLDSADNVYNKFHWYEPIVSGVGYRKRSKGTFFYYSPIIGQWNFVGIGGTRWSPALVGSKRFSNYQSIRGALSANYGFLNEDLKGSLDLEYTYAPMHNGSIAVNFGDEYEAITQSVDLAGIFARSNFIRKQFFEIYHRYEWFNGFYTRLGIEHSTRESIDDLQFAQWSNELFGDRNEPAPFETYTVAQLGVEILIRPFQRYYLKGRRKIVLSSKWPDFRFIFKQGIPNVLGSNVQFSKYEFVVDDMLRFGRFGESFYRLSSGGFLNDPSTVRFIEYKWFRGGDFLLFTHPLYTYQSLPETFASPSVYFTGSVMHHFDGFFLNRIPFVKRLNLGTSLGCTFLEVPAEEVTHFESFVGLEKKIKMWNVPVRFGCYHLISPSDAAPGFRWKLGIDVKDTFNDRWNF